LQGIPPERVRIHACHSNYPGTHHRDVDVADILDLLLTINCQGLSVVAANGQHRVTTYRAVKQVVEMGGWPAGKLLIPGVIDTLTAVEEHPETVAALIEGYAALIGRGNVMAGTDCGFGTIVGVFETVVPTAVWSRLSVLSEGARLASQRLWPLPTVAV
jgi:5-methyltetrahydropteroyltriglutamate--homocysteine methyltransferase